jgi:hypothetical protein
VLALQGIDWQTQPADDVAVPGCQLFPETHFNLCEPFLSYWKRNGGLARFGYPITKAHQESIEGHEYTVQYFERRRMELHPEHAGTPYEVQLGLLGRAVFAAEGDRNSVPTPAGDVAAEVQQPVLDAAYAAIRARGERAKLAVGLVDVTGSQALVLARPFGKEAMVVALTQSAVQWHVTQVTEAPGADKGMVIDMALAQLQDPQGQGLNVYVTWPRISGNFARLSAAPGAGEERDGVSLFFKHENGGWRFLTAGTAFSEDDLRALGVPQDLWSYGVSVHGPGPS